MHSVRGSIRHAGVVGALSALAMLACASSAWAADGDLDPSFGDRGLVTTAVTEISLEAMAIDGQGRIVVAGRTNSDMAVARYLPSGVLDTTFSVDGIASFDFPGNAPDEMARGVAIDARGGIILAGCEGSDGFGLVCDDFALIRVSEDGGLDTSFGPPGSNGFVRRDFAGTADEAAAVVIDRQGRIVVAGITTNGANVDFAVARFGANGQPDLSFGNAGRATLDFTAANDDNDAAQALAIDAQDRIVLAGASVQGMAGDFALARLTDAGVRDASFGNTPGRPGQVITPVGAGVDIASAVAIDAQGRILAGGNAVVDGGPQFALVRYNADGSLDTTFSDDGKVVTEIRGDSGGGDQIRGLTFDPQERIVVGGLAFDNAANSELALARYQTGGALDPTFGTAGIVRVPNRGAVAAAIDAQDRIVTAGSVTNANGAILGFGPARFIGDSVAPIAAIGAGPAEGSFINNPTPAFELSASEAGATFTCALGGVSGSCTSPFTPSSPLADGPHTFTVTAADRAGNASVPQTRSFTVDTLAPEIDINGKKKVKTGKKKGKSKLRIETSEPAELICKVDKKRPKPCGEKFKTRLRLGKHKIRVTATDLAGNASNEKKKVRVVRKR